MLGSHRTSQGLGGVLAWVIACAKLRFQNHATVCATQSWITLNNGVQMPSIAFGESDSSIIEHALRSGHPHIDTSEVNPTFYRLKRVLKKYERNSFFLTSKIDVTAQFLNVGCATNGSGWSNFLLRLLSVGRASSWQGVFTQRKLRVDVCCMA